MGNSVKASRNNGPVLTVIFLPLLQMALRFGFFCCKVLALEGGECHPQLLLERILDNSSNLEISLLLCFLSLAPTRPPSYERVD